MSGERAVAVQRPHPSEEALWKADKKTSTDGAGETEKEPVDTL